jgi:CRP-like cAMP-binding protein
VSIQLSNDGRDSADVMIVARRLSAHSALPAQAAAALSRLLGRRTEFGAGALIAEAGDEADLVTVMREGVACRMSLLPDGRRQIHSLLLAGDTADAEAPLLGVRQDNIEALTRCSVWLIPKTRLTALLHTQPELAQAFAREAAIAGQVARQWVVNLGQRDATERIAHLICELHARMEAVGLAREDAFPLPVTQLAIADAQGLSAVHVNRVL